MTAAEPLDGTRPGRGPAGPDTAGAPGGRCVDGARPTAAVVGGGLAGLAAATALAERGVAVTVYERQPYLGRRAGAGRPPCGAAPR
ncbi:hypothetical protein GCM10010345_20490 [Streptomyces canarius]|uniref:Amine oxidase domain-containing protein n=1 Tax=Streptomyces canarius TaxID=285453 RepID=A0ABQ3CHJ4_9ACTN|nr:hypothetical protein GCM10010345_20490 [Streptomyces canarius]